MSNQQDIRKDTPVDYNAQGRPTNESLTTVTNITAPTGAKTFSNAYKTDNGKTNVQEQGYVDVKSNNGVTTTTIYNEVVKTTKTEGGDVNSLRFTTDNVNAYQSGRNSTTTSYATSGPRRISGMGKGMETETRYSNIGQGLTGSYTTTGIYNTNVNSASNIYNTTTTTGSSRLLAQPVISNEGRSSIYGGGKRQSMIAKESYLVQENVHEPRIVEVREGEKRIVDVREGLQVTKSETITHGETRIVSEIEGERRRQRVSRRAVAEQDNTEIEIVKQNKIIEIIVAPNGQSRVETKGFTGSECRQASQFIERALGLRTDEVLKAEFHQTAASQRHVTEGQ